MRGKKAKLLRKVAKTLTGGMEEVKYQDKALNPRKPARRTRFLYDCGRLVYKNLKRTYK